MLYLAENQTAELSSPGYPNLYPVDVDCLWVLSSQHPGQITIRFLAFAISPWLYDHTLEYLDIGLGEHTMNSTYLFRLWGSLYPHSIVVNDSTAWIQFHSSMTLNQKNIGFHLQIDYSNSYDEGKILLQFMDCRYTSSCQILLDLTFSLSTGVLKRMNNCCRLKMF